MKTLDFKPVKRCGQCNHLIPQSLTECPYCKGRSFINRVHVEKEKPVNPTTVNLTMPKFEITPKQKKIALALVLLAALVWGMVMLAQYITNSRALGKSIFEPLSESAIENQVQKDNNFSSFYSKVEAIRETIQNPEDQKKYAKVTYKQLKEFLTYYSDEFYCDKVEKNARARHGVEAIAPIQPQIDELNRLENPELQ